MYSRSTNGINLGFLNSFVSEPLGTLRSYRRTQKLIFLISINFNIAETKLRPV